MYYVDRRSLTLIWQPPPMPISISIVAVLDDAAAVIVGVAMFIVLDVVIDPISILADI